VAGHGEAELAEGGAARQVARLGVAREVADERNAVETGHETPRNQVRRQGVGSGASFSVRSHSSERKEDERVLLTHAFVPGEIKRVGCRGVGGDGVRSRVSHRLYSVTHSLHHPVTTFITLPRSAADGSSR